MRKSIIVIVVALMSFSAFSQSNLSKIDKRLFHFGINSNFGWGFNNINAILSEETGLQIPDKRMGLNFDVSIIREEKLDMFLGLDVNFGQDKKDADRLMFTQMKMFMDFHYKIPVNSFSELALIAGIGAGQNYLKYSFATNQPNPITDNLGYSNLTMYQKLVYTINIGAQFNFVVKSLQISPFVKWNIPLNKTNFYVDEHLIDKLPKLTDNNISIGFKVGI